MVEKDAWEALDGLFGILSEEQADRLEEAIAEARRRWVRRRRGSGASADETGTE